MKQTMTLLALFAMLILTATIGCQKENNNRHTSATDTMPHQPDPQPDQFSLSGTAWISTHDEWWTLSMHVIDTSIWRFLTDSTGTIYEHRIYNDDDPYGGNTFQMTYSFDTTTMKGILYGYDEPLVFTYHPEDTTITIRTQGITTYYLLPQ